MSALRNVATMMGFFTIIAIYNLIVVTIVLLGASMLPLHLRVPDKERSSIYKGPGAHHLLISRKWVDSATCESGPSTHFVDLSRGGDDLQGPCATEEDGPISGDGPMTAPSCNVMYRQNSRFLLNWNLKCGLQHEPWWWLMGGSN